MGKNCVVLGDKYDITLWGFKCQLRDRRNGEITEGYIVVTGNAEYDLEAAHREIESKYGRMGYTVIECIYDATKVWNYDAIEIFESAPAADDREPTKSQEEDEEEEDEEEEGTIEENLAALWAELEK